MNEPLDLRALEARLKFGDSLDAAECGGRFLSYHNSIEVPHGCSCERCQQGRIAFALARDDSPVLSE